MKIELTEQELVKIYDIVFSHVHSNGFKISEIKDLLFKEDYWFNEQPNDNWYNNLMAYLESIQYDINLLNINKRFKNQC